MKQEEKSLLESLEELKTAIQNLELFANTNEREAIPHAQAMKVVGNTIVSTPLNTLEKTMDLMKSLLPKARKQSRINRLAVQKKLVESIEFLKTHYRVIHKMKKGNETEQAYATWAHHTIDRYNSLIAKAKEAPRSLAERMERFVYKKSGLSLDEEIKKIKIDIPDEFSIRSASLYSDST